MSFDRQFLAMLPQSISYRAYVGTSSGGYGATDHGSTSTTKTVRARIQAVRADVRSLSSREVVGASFKLITAPWSTAGTSDAVSITALDKITLPAGFLVAGSCAPPIIRAYPVQDESGHHHNEVWI